MSTLGTVLSALAAVVVIAIGIRVDLSKVVRTLEAVRVVLPVACYMLVTELVGPTKCTLRFDEVGAQVIVVLLLALAVESRFFRLNPGEDRLNFLGTCLLMVVLATGEYYALRALFSSEPRHGELVAGAVAGGFAGVAITALTGSRLGEARVPSHDDRDV